MSHHTARDAVLEAFKSLERSSGRKTFTPQEIIDEVMRHTSAFKESTIRTHVVSRLCREAPDNHQSTYDDLTRVGPGLYRRIT